MFLLFQACPSTTLIPEGFLDEAYQSSEPRAEVQPEPGGDRAQGEPSQEPPHEESPTPPEPPDAYESGSADAQEPLVDVGLPERVLEPRPEREAVPERAPPEPSPEKVVPEIPKGAACLRAAIKALAIATPGTIVTLCEGNHDVNDVQKTPLMLRAGVTLRGASRTKTILRHSGTIGPAKGRLGAVINIINAPRARVSNLTVRGPTNRNAYAGVWIENSSYVYIDKCDFFDFAMPSVGFAIFARGKADRIVFDYNYFDGNRNGITTATGSKLTLTYIRYNRFGTRPGAVGHIGAAIYDRPGSVNVQIVGNVIKQGRLSRGAKSVADGILVQGTSRFNVSDNTIDMNKSGRHGIMIQALTGYEDSIIGTIARNSISNVTQKGGPTNVGIYVFGVSPKLKLVRVAIGSNTTKGDPGVRTLQWSVPKAPVRVPTWNTYPNAPPYFTSVPTFPNTSLIYP